MGFSRCLYHATDFLGDIGGRNFKSAVDQGIASRIGQCALIPAQAIDDCSGVAIRMRLLCSEGDYWAAHEYLCVRWWPNQLGAIGSMVKVVVGG